MKRKRLNYKAVVALLLITTFLPSCVQGCLSAYQARLFPVSACDSGTVFIQTNLLRSEARNSEVKSKAVWTGDIFIKVYTSEFVEVYSEKIDSIAQISIDSVELIINKNLENQFSSRSNNIIKPIDITYCNNAYSCFYNQFKYDSVSNQLLYRWQNKKDYPISVLNGKKNISLDIWIRFNSLEGHAKTLSNIAEFISLNSVRRYSINDKNLVIIHLSTGQRSANESSKKDDEVFKPKTINTTSLVNPEKVMSHGSGFDFFFYE